MCACPPGDCPDVRTTATDAGTNFVLEVGQWIALQLPGPNTNVAATSSEPAVLKLVGKQRLSYDNDGKVGLVYLSFHALKAGSAQLNMSYLTCPVASRQPCSYDVESRVVQFPKVKVDLYVGFVSPTPSPAHLRIGESARLTVCCVYGPDEPKVSVDRADVLHWAIDPFATHPSGIAGALAAVSSGTARISGAYCPQTPGPCPRPWSVTVIVS